MTEDDSTEARAVVLDRIRAALDPPTPRPAFVRAYQTVLPAGIEVVELFTERVSDYQATVHAASPTELPAVLGRVIAARRALRVVMPPGLPPEWVDGISVDWVFDDPPLTKAQLDEVDAVISGCAVAIAETGTIVLSGGPAQGRRALTLLPDTHLCVVRIEQIVGSVPEALGLLKGTQPLTWISGPSATSDIELDRIEGVHGPRKLDVILVR